MPRSHSKRPCHAAVSERAPRRSQSRQMAQTFAPPSVRVEQSPHTGLAHDAQGPAAARGQKLQRVMSSPSAR